MTTSTEYQKKYMSKPGVREKHNKKHKAQRIAVTRLKALHRAEYLKFYFEACQEVGLND